MAWTISVVATGADSTGRGMRWIRTTFQLLSVSSIQTNFPVSTDGGVSGALNQLFSDFSSWSVSPTSTASQQTVIDDAQQVSEAFQQAYSGLSQDLTGTGQQIQATVTQINNYASQLAADSRESPCTGWLSR